MNKPQTIAPMPPDDFCCQLWNKYISDIMEVYAIFQDHFGVDNVDIQSVYTFDLFKQEIESLYTSQYINTYTLSDLSTQEVTQLFETLDKRRLDKLEQHSKFCIIVHFPEVRVTNERGKYIDITHVWVKTKLTRDGKLYGIFSLNRSEYTFAQLQSNYLHSHVRDIPYERWGAFQHPCLGTGPLMKTCETLARCNDTAIWHLYCVELEMFLKKESIAGIPYHYLEEVSVCYNDICVSRNNYIMNYDTTRHRSDLMIKAFIPYLLKQKIFKFGYINNTFTMALPYTKLLLLISSCFIDWFNLLKAKGELADITSNVLINQSILIPCVKRGQQLYKYEPSRRDFSAQKGSYVLTFKNQDVTLEFSDLEKISSDVIYILDTKIVARIIGKILRVLNYRYEKETFAQQEHTIPAVPNNTWYCGMFATLQG